MGELGKGFIKFMLRHSVWVIVITLLITLGASLLIPRIHLDNSVDAFFDKKSKSYLDFQSWKEQFGSDEVVIIAFSDKDIFTLDNLGLIARLTRSLESIKYVRKVTSITNVNDISGLENDFIVEPLVKEIPSDPIGLAELKRRALNNPLYIKNLISEDGGTTAIFVELENKGSSYKKETIESIQGILKKEFPQDKKYYLSGLPAIEYFFTAFMQQDLRTFLPLIFVIILLSLYIAFRNLKKLISSLSVVLITLAWTMAFLYLCGFSINNVTTVIPPIILAYCLSDSIHIIVEISRRAYKGKIGARNDEIAGAFWELLKPCFLTSITTVAGFFSLIISRVPAVRELGLITGAGVSFAFIITFTFLPAAIKSIRLSPEQPGAAESVRGLEKFLKGVGIFIQKHKVFIIALTTFITIVSVWGLSRIKTETSVLEYFKKDSSLYQATIFIERHLSGVHFLNVSLRAGERDYFKDPKVLRKIEGLEEFLKTFPEVDKTISVGDYLKEINKSFHNEDSAYYVIPDSRKTVEQFLLLYGAGDLRDFVNEEWDWTTLRIRLNEHTTSGLKKVIHRIQVYLNENFKDIKEKSVLGQTVLEVEANEAVTRGQTQSLSLAFIVIFGIMFMVFRSFSLGLISIIPNLLPLLMNFGIMGFSGIRLNSATSMISAIGIGIIVDNTIHFLNTCLDKFKETHDYFAAINDTLVIKGRSMLFTSFILFFGFGVVSFSNFVPTEYFGILSALLMVSALLGDIILLPTLIAFFKPKKI